MGSLLNFSEREESVCGVHFVTGALRLFPQSQSAKCYIPTLQFRNCLCECEFKVNISWWFISDSMCEGDFDWELTLTAIQAAKFDKLTCVKET